MRDAQNISELVQLDINFIGFIFYGGPSGSRRHVSEFPEVNIPKHIKKVGVFVNESIDEVVRIVSQNGLNAVQLHGNTETIAYCRKLAEDLKMAHSELNSEPHQAHQTDRTIEIIKVFSVGSEFDFEITEAYERFSDYFLFDTKGKNYGGTGKKFDWDILSNYKGETPYLLSGGIALTDVNAVKAFFKSDAAKHCIGLDINSGFEDEIALKNITEIKEFIDKTGHCE